MCVALLAEGVDRNVVKGRGYDEIQTSPSSRRAWIEIEQLKILCVKLNVALLAEGVDRNLLSVQHSAMLEGRPPRGGRG